MKREYRIEKKKNEALIRQEAYSKLTPNQKIQKLDQKFGKGVGAKERKRMP
jgi:hypothetical protein